MERSECAVIVCKSRRREIAQRMSDQLEEYATVKWKISLDAIDMYVKARILNEKS